MLSHVVQHRIGPTLPGARATSLGLSAAEVAMSG